MYPNLATSEREDPGRRERPVMWNSQVAGSMRPNLATSERDSQPANQSAGPQLITNLGDSVRGLQELSHRLADVAVRLRGSQPECGQDPSSKIPELTLQTLTEEFRDLVEFCYGKVAEISALLS